MIIEESVRDNKCVQEAVFEGETEVDEVIVKVFNSSKYYNIFFQIGVIISHKDIK